MFIFGSRVVLDTRKGGPITDPFEAYDLQGVAF